MEFAGGNGFCPKHNPQIAFKPIIYLLKIGRLCPDAVEPRNEQKQTHHYLRPKRLRLERKKLTDLESVPITASFRQILVGAKTSCRDAGSLLLPEVRPWLLLYL